MNQLKIPEAFLPGDNIREELESREWTQRDLAAIIDRPANVVNDIIKGRRSITLEIANLLGRAFGTSAEYWVNMQKAYDYAVKELKNEDAVEKRAELYKIAPIREMIHRGWIEDTNNADFLEAQVLKFLERKTLKEESAFAHAARKSDNNERPNSLQATWLMRAKMLAPAAPVMGVYNEANFKKLKEELEPLRLEPEAISQVPKILCKYGIRFLLIEYLPQAKIDGACFWLNNDANSPVIVLSMRFDRIDWFWHTLMHELYHIKNGDGRNAPILETCIRDEDAQPSESKSQQEQAADKFAVEFLVDQRELDNFIARNKRAYSDTNIKAFSKLHHVHPGIVVGQMHHRGVFHWKYFSDMKVKIKEYIINTALTDGWGKIVTI
jgi:HTH-type transcriptional regulator/antitoxin HigA